MVKRTLTGVALEFSDGTVERPEKCSCWIFGKESGESVEITAHFLSMSGIDLLNLANAITNLFTEDGKKVLRTLVKEENNDDFI